MNLPPKSISKTYNSFSLAQKTRKIEKRIERREALKREILKREQRAMTTWFNEEDKSFCQSEDEMKIDQKSKCSPGNNNNLREIRQ